MKDPKFGKVILFSFLGHLTLFSVFSFSFGNSLPSADSSSAYFWGRFLPNMHISSASTRIHLPVSLPISRIFYQDSVIKNQDYSIKVGAGYYLKPPFTLECCSEKQVFAAGNIPAWPSVSKKEPAILFHPLLPYDFTLYFRDRQIAHVELEYKIPSSKGGRRVMLKRKISSGNLEADLLIQRYIGRYLFMQQFNLPQGNWQTVKINLSIKND